MTTQRPAPTPEGELIGKAAKSAGITVKKAAERAGISDTRWRQIVAGYQTPTRGQHIPVEGRPDTVARMAYAVGLLPEQLEGVGRTDAATILRVIRSDAAAQESAPPTHVPRASTSVLADDTEIAIWSVESMSPEERADHIAALRVRRVTAELREEKAAMQRELEELRRQLSMYRRQQAG
jgi:hypothetical protein